MKQRNITHADTHTQKKFFLCMPVCKLKLVHIGTVSSCCTIPCHCREMCKSRIWLPYARVSINTVPCWSESWLYVCTHWEDSQDWHHWNMGRQFIRFKPLLMAGSTKSSQPSSSSYLSHSVNSTSSTSLPFCPYPNASDQALMTILLTAAGPVHLVSLAPVPTSLLPE